jgi:hypothetical protein
MASSESGYCFVKHPANGLESAYKELLIRAYSSGPHRDTPRRASTPERVGVRIMSALNLACRNCALMQFLLLRIL